MMDHKGSFTILHINTNDLRGGAAKVAWRLLAAQRESNHHANMLVGYKESNSEFVFPFDIKPDHAQQNFFQETGLLYYHLQGSDRLPDHPLVQTADVLHLHNLHGNYFNPFSLPKLAQSKPVVWTLHDMQAVTGHCAYSFECNKWEVGCGECPDLRTYPSIAVDSTNRLWKDKKRIYQQSPLTIVTPSLWLKRIVEKSVLKDHRIELIYNGVDTKLFHPHDKKAIRLKHGLPLNKLVIGCVANLFSDTRKGASFFDEIMQELINHELDVLFLQIGGKSQQESSPYVMRTGYVRDERTLSELYSAMDLFVFPSIADNCPLVLSEAMACGVPVVSFRTGGIPEIVHHGETGFIAEQADVKTLTQYIYLLLADEKLRLDMSIKSRAYAEKFYGHEKIVKQYEEIYLREIRRFEEEKENCGKKRIISASSRQTPFKVLIYSKEEPTLNPLKERIIGEGLELTFTNNLDDILESGAQFVYLHEQGYELDPHFFQMMLKDYAGQDLIACELWLMRNDDIPFFKVLPMDLDEPAKYDLSKKSCMLFNKEFFLRHKTPILNGHELEIGHVSFLFANAVNVRLGYYLEQKLKPFVSGRVLIYGAGSHTEVLLNHLHKEAYKLVGIMDKNPSIRGTQLFGLPVYHPSDISDLSIDCVLISSYSYEREIYRELVEMIEPDKIVALYSRF